MLTHPRVVQISEGYPHMDKFIATIPQTASSPFDSIRHIDNQGHEFWFARELMPVMDYKSWQKFNKVIDIAVENLETVAERVIDHVNPTDKMVQRPQGGGAKMLDYKLSRLACYHIALCCDSRGNDAVKSAKHYFAIKTREAEVVIPQQNDRLRELELQNQILSQQLQLRQLDNNMLVMHGKETVLALRGVADQVVRTETKTTEIVEPDTGRCTNILSAKQLKDAIYERTGQKIKSMSQVTEALRKAGRDDLLIPVRRSQVAEYVPPDALDEVIRIVFRAKRQMLIGE
jgi:DNA-damage-inducible protein D